MDLFFAPLIDRASKSLHLLLISKIKSINLSQEFLGGSFDISLNQSSTIQRKQSLLFIFFIEYKI